ncbi:SUKH-4 family immunity protein [Streptomyces aureus]|uniref:SUKH-4 family immunity protein n=1 Tax=Streptomyces aureus TaxID=193461 RepID=UPI0033D2CD62
MNVVAGILSRVESTGADGTTLIHDAVRHVLAEPVWRLVTDESRVAVDAAAHWDLPAGDRAALLEWGLPRLPLFTPRAQPDAVPTLLPNRAGDAERRLVQEGVRLYDLGYWGPDEGSCVVAVVPQEGRVLCLLPAPITVDDLPEVLRPYYQGLHKPAVSFFSSSVARYVETAWRWHAALGVLRQIEEPEFTAGEAEYLRHHDLLYSLVKLVTEAVGRIDPVAEGEGLTSVWIELILGNSF